MILIHLLCYIFQADKDLSGEYATNILKVLTD